MFMLTMGEGMLCATVPDVCKTPAPDGAVPMPYPNIGESAMANPGLVVPNVLVVGMPAMNLGSTLLMTDGDTAGIEGGVESGVVMGEAAFVKGSMIVMVGGKPAVRMGDMTTHNMENTMGLVTSPGQVIVDANG